MQQGVFDQEDIGNFRGQSFSDIAMSAADLMRLNGAESLLPNSMRNDIKSPTTNKTIVYKDGTYQAIMNDGSRRVFDAKDNLLQGEDAQRAIEAGVNSGIQFEGEKARVTADSKYSSQLKNEPELQKRITLIKNRYKSRSDDESTLSNLETNIPVLQEVVGNLKALGAVATYTAAGKAYDQIVRQLGFSVPDGATARAKYIATVDNEVLPLLKATFGSAFTEKEGQSLKATLGDPDLSPAEKDAQLDAFIEQKIRQVNSLKQKLNQQDNSGETGSNSGDAELMNKQKRLQELRSKQVR